MLARPSLLVGEEKRIPVDWVDFSHYYGPVSTRLAEPDLPFSMDASCPLPHLGHLVAALPSWEWAAPQRTAGILWEVVTTLFIPLQHRITSCVDVILRERLRNRRRYIKESHLIIRQIKNTSIRRYYGRRQFFMSTYRLEITSYGTYRT